MKAGFIYLYLAFPIALPAIIASPSLEIALFSLTIVVSDEAIVRQDKALGVKSLKVVCCYSKPRKPIRSRRKLLYKPIGKTVSLL